MRLGPALNLFVVPAQAVGPGLNFFVVPASQAANLFVVVRQRPALYYRFFAISGQWLKSIPAKLLAQGGDLGGEFVGMVRLCDSHICDPSSRGSRAAVRGPQILSFAGQGASFKLATGSTMNDYETYAFDPHTAAAAFFLGWRLSLFSSPPCSVRASNPLPTSPDLD